MLRLCLNLRCFKYVRRGTSLEAEHFRPKEAVAAIMEYAPSLERFKLYLLNRTEYAGFTKEDIRKGKAGSGALWYCV